MPTSTKLETNWTKTTDATERRRIQNRLAQRNYRHNIKQRLLQLEQLDSAILKSVALNGGTHPWSENDQSEMLQQHHNTTAYPLASPSLDTRPENNFSWLPHQNGASATVHPEIQMDSNQRIFAMNSPNSNGPLSPPSQHQQYGYFDNPPSTPQEQHTPLAFDRPLSHQASTPSGTPSPYQTQHAPVENQPHPTMDVVFPPNQMQTPPPHSKRASTGSPPRTATLTILPGQPGSTTPASGTPLHQAAANGHLPILRFLVLEGASLTAQDEAGQTILHLAAARGHEEVIKYTLGQGQGGEGGEAKAIIDWVDHQGFTALHRAAAGGYEDCVRLLVEAGARIEGSTR